MKTGIFLVWKDAVSCDDWISVDEAKDEELAEIRTLGLLVHQDQFVYRIALNWDVSNGKVSQVLTVPKAWVSFVLILPGLPESLSISFSRNSD